MDFNAWKMAFEKLHRWKQWDRSVLQLVLSIVSKISTFQGFSSTAFRMESVKFFFLFFFVVGWFGFKLNCFNALGSFKSNFFSFFLMATQTIEL